MEYSIYLEDYKLGITKLEKADVPYYEKEFPLHLKTYNKMFKS